MVDPVPERKTDGIQIFMRGRTDGIPEESVDICDIKLLRSVDNSFISRIPDVPSSSSSKKCKNLMNVKNLME